MSLYTHTHTRAHTHVCVCQQLVVSDSLRPHGLCPARLLCPWDFSDKNTGVGCHSLLQGTFLTQGLNPGILHCRQTLYRLSHYMCLYTYTHVHTHTYQHFFAPMQNTYRKINRNSLLSLGKEMNSSLTEMEGRLFTVCCSVPFKHFESCDYNTYHKTNYI